MSVGRRLAPSRSNLLAVGRRLDRVNRGAALLRKKREALVVELFRVARPALQARLEISEAAREAWLQALSALALHGEARLETLGLPERTVDVALGTRMVWGVEVATISERPPVVRTPAVRGLDVGSVGPTVDATTTAFERLVERLLDEAPREMLMTQLGEQLVRTTRQVHVLEQRLLPELRAGRQRIHAVLDEREREDHVRMRRLLERRRAAADS